MYDKYTALDTIALSSNLHIHKRTEVHYVHELIPFPAAF